MVTPEAVVLELSAAGVGTRVLAKLIDLCCMAAVTALVFSGLGFAMNAVRIGTNLGIILLLVWLFVLLFLLPAASEVLWDGRTPGKSALGLRVVTLDGGPISARHALIRGIFQIVDIYLPFGLLVGMSTRPTRRFGDLVAGTFVVLERSAANKGRALIFTPPPGLEAYTATLDVGMMTEKQYVLIREFLMRTNELTPAARAHLALRLSDESVTRLEAPRPYWLAPEQHLLCVAAARQQRSGTHADATSRAVPNWGVWQQPSPMPPPPPPPAALASR
jgi:uncharacterized RDD family membrane protein YckC